MITGTFNGAGHAIFVTKGFTGTITLSNVTITTTDVNSCIWYDGGIGNLPTSTNTILYIDGTNNLWSDKNCKAGSYDKATINIKAGCRVTIEDSKNGDEVGKLIVKIGELGYSYGIYSPAIGAGIPEEYLYNPLYINQSTTKVLVYAGGDLIIKSGTIHATGGGHSAGIGGAVGGLRNIVVVGGDVTSIGGAHGSGIGGGCYAQSGTVVVLPPSKISAKSEAGLTAVGGGARESAGDLRIFYMGDPDLKKLRITAQEKGKTANTGFKNVNILFDVSEDKTISDALKLAGLNPARWYAGTTGSDGYWETTGKIVGTVKVFSDTMTTQTPPAYYSSKRVSVDGTKDTHIVLEEPDLTIPYLTVSKTPDTHTNGSVTIKVSAEDTLPDVVRIRAQGGTWVNTTSFILHTVTNNGIYWFEAEDSDGNTQAVSCIIDNIDKGKSEVTYVWDSG